MKQVLFFIAFFAFAQTISAQVSPPSNIGKTFSSAHPNLQNQNVNWVLENGNYRAEFITIDSTRNSVMYDKSGKLMESQVDIKDTELPLSARESMKGQKPNRLTRTTDANGVVKYRATVEDKEMFFDDKGKQQQAPPQGNQNGTQNSNQKGSQSGGNQNGNEKGN